MAKLQQRRQRSAPRRRGIEMTAQPLSQQAHGDDRDAHGKARRERHPRRILDEIASVAEHQSPIRRRRLHAEAEEAENGTEQDREGEAEAAFYHDEGPE